MEAKGHRKVYDLVYHLYHADHVSSSYELVANNCKHLAAAVFNNINGEGRVITAGISGDLP